MNIGYACISVGVRNTELRSCIQKNATETKLMELIEHNLKSLDTMIHYNINNKIKLFRISSDLIPFGSSPVNKLPWWEIHEQQLKQIGEKIKQSGMRVSMHPGQYTVLNSPDDKVVARAMEDLNYHTKVLDSLGVGPSHKIVLHIGGIYNDKPMAMQRFITNYSMLSEEVKKRLVLENDDKMYNIKDVLEISSYTKAPVIFDNLHNKINPPSDNKDEVLWIEECKRTWKEKDGQQKIHYSRQNPKKQPGSHSETIVLHEFMEFIEKLSRNDIDIMLEVKDKNLSAVKCINATSKNKNIKDLEIEWSKYKYCILEKSHSDYSEIRKILKDKKTYPVLPFYQVIEGALEKETTIGEAVNAAQHVWGYFKEIASEKEKSDFLKLVESYKEGGVTLKKVKSFLQKMTLKYQEEYLLNSYYFDL
jgi:UV DNA damage endonuclease